MGAKAKNATRSRQSKHPPALTSEDVAGPSAKVGATGDRVTRKKASRGRSKKRRLYPESVPPAMVHEVFDVSGAEDETSAPSVPPQAAPPRLFSKPPPHPPRPSHRPEPAEDEELELDEDLLREDPGERLLTPGPMSAAVMPRRAGAGLWVAIGAGVLGLGVLLGTRMRPVEGGRPSASPQVERATLVTPVAEPGPASTATAELAPPSEANAEPATSAASMETEASPAPSVAPSEHPALGQVVVPASRVDLDAPPFDAEAANAAITAAFARAAACRGPSDPPGEVTATLTYAPSGRITSATVSGVFAGTPVGGCIAATLRAARVPAFSGDYLTVKRTTLLK